MEAVITDKAAGVVLPFAIRLFYNQALRIETPLNGYVRVSDSNWMWRFCRQKWL